MDDKENFEIKDAGKAMDENVTRFSVGGTTMVTWNKDANSLEEMSRSIAGFPASDEESKTEDDLGL